MIYAEVAVDFPDDRARTFTYAVPAGIQAVPGDVVTVPFGAQELNGVVFSLSGAPPAEEAREVSSVLEGGPHVSPERLELARWMAGYYRTTLFVAVSVMMAPGLTVRSRAWVSRSPEFEQAPWGMNEAEQRAWDRVPPSGRIRKDKLARSLGRAGTKIVARLVRRKLFVQSAGLDRPASRPLVKAFVVLAAPPELALARASEMSERRTARQAALLRHLADGSAPDTRAAAVRMFGVAAVDRLVEAGLVRVEERRVLRDPLAGYAVQGDFPPDLTTAQAEAVVEVVRAVGAGHHSFPSLAGDRLNIASPQPPPAGGRGNEASTCAQDPPHGNPVKAGIREVTTGKFLLFGVTGSGKTEVYIRAVEACVRAGKRALVMVPEISLTPQTLRRFATRFPGRVALQHSGLAVGARFDQWESIRDGNYDVVLGPRSAVFAPQPDLGLVVVDEEHEWTYKQHDLAPRYHARDVAERLCALTGAVLVLGSATPSVESFRRAERGELRLLSLPASLAPSASQGAGPRDRVRVVDMREELRAGRAGVLSAQLVSAMREALSAGGNVILFINRRGVASFIQCKECGTVRRCRRCDTSLTYHRPGRGAGGHLLCHYCGLTSAPARKCPHCGGVQALRLGAGTQAVAEAAESLFPRAGVVRWDSDSASARAEHTALLERFESGLARILVGTQLVAKGLDVPSVTLAGIVSADVGLAVPDFRSAERTFQLLTQAAGRAGRGAQRGRVVIQTLQPEHYAIRAASREDYEGFYRAELTVRSKFAYPPFTRLVRLLYSSPDADDAMKVAGEMGARLKQERIVSGDTATDVLGPTPAYPLRVRGKYRWQVVLRGPAPTGLLDRSAPGRGWVVDVDPASLA